jgi:hypothetical protein
LDIIFQGRLGDSTYSPGNVDVAERQVNSFFDSLNKIGQVKKEVINGDITAMKFPIQFADIIRSMPGPYGSINLKFKDGVLNISGDKMGWGFSRDIPVKEFQGGDVSLRVVNEMFKNIINMKYQVRADLLFINGVTKKSVVLHIFDEVRGFYVTYFIPVRDVK